MTDADKKKWMEAGRQTPDTFIEWWNNSGDMFLPTCTEWCEACSRSTATCGVQEYNDISSAFEQYENGEIPVELLFDLFQSNVRGIMEILNEKNCLI